MGYSPPLAIRGGQVTRLSEDIVDSQSWVRCIPLRAYGARF